MSAPVIILDRDGVINQDSDAHVRSLAEWQPIPGSLEAIARASRAGWRVVVCTNQSGVGRGLFPARVVDDIHRELQRRVEALGGRIEGIFYCPHAPDAGCRCRKPLPGLLQQAASGLGFALADVPVIGDSARDLEAARAVHATPILVRTGKGEGTLDRGEAGGAVVYADLAEAIDALVRGNPA